LKQFYRHEKDFVNRKLYGKLALTPGLNCKFAAANLGIALDLAKFVGCGHSFTDQAAGSYLQCSTAPRIST
jgi:hypothetical protein